MLKILLSFKELSKYFINPDFSGGRCKTSNKNSFDSGKTMSLKMLSMSKKKLEL